MRAEAARAHANPLDPALDDRPDDLKVRLEPARAHVVRVADLPAHHRRLPANLASLGHQLLQLPNYQLTNLPNFGAKKGVGSRFRYLRLENDSRPLFRCQGTMMRAGSSA